MAIFAVTFFDDETNRPTEEQYSIINKFDKFEKHPLYFLSFGGEPKDLANLLGFHDGEKKSGIVIRVSQYTGYEEKELWDWLREN